MKFVIILPLPLDAWDVFYPFVQRFIDTFRTHPPGYDDYRLAVVVEGGTITKDIAAIFYGLKPAFFHCPHDGADIGGAQYVANHLGQLIDLKNVKSKEDWEWIDSWILGMTSRCYFHRAGWLSRLADAINKHGDGLYGASASFEGFMPHICTRGYALPAYYWREYPHLIDSRAKGPYFENGQWCLTSWCRSQGLECWQVTWDGEQQQEQWRTPRNIFRHGDQSNMLWWDKHTDWYAHADHHEKIRLIRLLNAEIGY